MRKILFTSLVALLAIAATADARGCRGGGRHGGGCSSGGCGGGAMMGGCSSGACGGYGMGYTQGCSSCVQAPMQQTYQAAQYQLPAGGSWWRYPDGTLVYVLPPQQQQQTAPAYVGAQYGQ